MGTWNSTVHVQLNTERQISACHQLPKCQRYLNLFHNTCAKAGASRKYQISGRWSVLVQSLLMLLKPLGLCMCTDQSTTDSSVLRRDSKLTQQTEHTRAQEAWPVQVMGRGTTDGHLLMQYVINLLMYNFLVPLPQVMREKSIYNNCISLACC